MVTIEEMSEDNSPDPSGIGTEQPQDPVTPNATRRNPFQDDPPETPQEVQDQQELEFEQRARQLERDEQCRRQIAREEREYYEAEAAR